jgi:hypothetical protein
VGLITSLVALVLVVGLVLLHLSIEFLKLLHELLHCWSHGGFRIGAIFNHNWIVILVERWWRDFTLFPGH